MAERMRPGQRTYRNKPCVCGSGRKYKNCCFATDRQGAEEKIFEALSKAFFKMKNEQESQGVLLYDALGKPVR